MTTSDSLRPACSTCPYWDGTSHSITAHCKRYAPRRHAGPTIWAHTNRDDYCGEHPDFPAYIATIREQNAGTLPDRAG